MAEACKAAGPGSVELFEMDAGSKESVTALAKAVEGKVLLHRVPISSADMGFGGRLSHIMISYGFVDAL